MAWRKREIMEMALEALENNQYLVADHKRHAYVMEYNSIIEKCKETLAQPEQAPVAWMYPDDLKRFETSEAYAEAYSIEMVSPTQGETVPLYTTPPQRTWVGLTPKEVAEIVIYPMNKTADLVRIIEAKLKEKNEY